MSLPAYAPRTPEIPILEGAIRLEQQATVEPPAPDVDRRYIAGYIDGACATLAACDPYGEEPTDRALWREIQRVYKYGPGFHLSGAYREYIRAAARTRNEHA
jgi:hypothetical protein